MATGGTGDILTGMISGMVAQAVSGSRGKALDETDHAQLLLYVLAAVFLHGLAGDLGRDQLGEHSLIASDLLKYLPTAFGAVRERARERFVPMN